MKATRPKRPARTEKQVYQEAGSRCVFCPERDVSALQVHHINSDRTNNAFDNLILVCATCHAKITAGVIPESEVITKKRQLRFEPQTADSAVSIGNGNVIVDRTVNTGTIAHTINKFEKGRTPRMHYPQGTIGSDAMRRNYIDYLITRYFECRKADASYGSRRPFAHAEIHKSIQKEFGAKTFFILAERFDALAAYLHRRIDKTILGRTRGSKGTPIYKTFSDYQAEQSAE
jgi:HNH endonuclease